MQSIMLKKTGLAALAAFFMLSSTGCRTDEPDMLTCDNINSPTTWSDINDNGEGVDYTLNCRLTVNSKLIIEAGTIIECGSGGGIVIDENGSIEIRGTAGKKVVIRSIDNSSVRGTWDGIIIYSNNVDNRIEHADISGGGANRFDSNGDLGNVIVSNNGRLRISNTTVRNSAAYGLNVLNGGAATMSANSFSNNVTPICVYADQAHQLDPASSYTDNDNQVVEVAINDISSIVTWRSLPVPYRVLPRQFSQIYVAQNGGLTIEAGADIQFGADCGIRSSESAYIKTLGTATQGVTLRGLSDVAGSWQGIYFQTNSVENQMRYTTVTGAGSSGFTSNNYHASVVVGPNSALNISDCTISKGAACGFYVDTYFTNVTSSNITYSQVVTNTCN
jgi:hypothetical protein